MIDSGRPRMEESRAMPRSAGVLAAVVLLSASPVARSAASQDAPRPSRPRVGLALGGGGARGAAHVGVLKVLERLHVRVDYIAGTSMGAIVGGLYAAGVPPETIEAQLEGLNWPAVLSDRAAYRDLVWRRKEDEGRYLLDLELGLRGGKLLVPTGIRAGQNLGFELQSLLLPVADVHDFGQLPIPFHAVATDVETGERVVLDHGDLALSILASMTVPGVFMPVEMDGRILVDGGMADNLPVEVVRAMGADVVIAVDVGTPLATRDAIRSFVGVTNQAFTFLTRLNSERSAKLADLVLQPRLEEISSGEFTAVAEAIELGEAAAEAQRSALLGYAADAASFEAWSAGRGRTLEPLPPIASIQVEGNERVDARVILAHAGIGPGDPVSVPQLRSAVRRVFGLDDFSWVRFRLAKAGAGQDVILQVKEKPWGPTYLHFGIEALDDLEGGASYGVKANLTRTDLNARGAEWRNDLEVGSSPSVRTEFFQPLDFKGRLFVAPWAELQRGLQPIYVEGQRVASYLVDSSGGELDAGIEYGRFGEVRLGVYRSHVRAKVETGAADLPRVDVDTAGVAFNAIFDTRDRPAIARHGGALSVRARLSRSVFGADDDYDRLEAGVSHFLGRGRHTAFGVLDFGTNLGSRLPPYDEFLVGGLFSLGGYSDGELRGQAYAGATLGYHYRISSLPSGLGEGVYVGITTDARNVWNASSEIALDDLRHGVTAILGADTVVGPIFFAYGCAEGGRRRIYLTVGRTL